MYTNRGHPNGVHPYHAECWSPVASNRTPVSSLFKMCVLTESIYFVGRIEKLAPGWLWQGIRRKTARRLTRLCFTASDHSWLGARTALMLMGFMIVVARFEN